MGSPTELASSWDRLSPDELDAVELLAATAEPLCRKMSDFLRASLKAESGHRDLLKVKATQVPDFDDWSDRDVADGYMAAVMISVAADASQRLSEWGSMLLHTVCLQMSSRLEMRHLATERWKRCEDN